MSPLLIAAMAAVGMAMTSSRRPSTPAPAPKPSGGGRNPSPEVLAAITGAARSAGIPLSVALAFADIESGFNPSAIGDPKWYEKSGGALYRKHVLNNPRLAKNPARTDPTVWKSYGLYQTLAAHHCPPNEHPRVLLDPHRNAQIGCTFIASLLKKANGDVRKARLAYVGCGLDGKLCKAEDVAKTLARLDTALKRWASVG